MARRTLLVITLPLIYLACFSQAPKGGTEPESLQSRLDALSNSVKEVNDTADQKLKKLEKKLESSENNLRDLLLEKNRIDYENQTEKIKNQFQAGENVLFHLMKETNSLNATLSMMELSDQFSKLSDPTSYGSFNEALVSSFEILGKKRLPFPQVDNIEEIKKQIPFLNNPIISVGTSLISVFLSSYHENSNEKGEVLSKMNCVLNYTNTVKSKHGLIRAEREMLSGRVTAFRQNVGEYFDEYLREIGYDGGSTKYADSDIEIRAKREKYFSEISSDTSKIGVFTNEQSHFSTLKFKIELVKFYLKEYELLMTEVGAFINTFKEVTIELSGSDQNLCAELFDDARSNLNIVKRKAEEAKASWEKVRDENKVKASTLTTLFGT